MNLPINKLILIVNEDDQIGVTKYSGGKLTAKFRVNGDVVVRDVHKVKEWMYVSDYFAPEASNTP